MYVMMAGKDLVAKRKPSNELTATKHMILFSFLSSTPLAFQNKNKSLLEEFV